MKSIVCIATIIIIIGGFLLMSCSCANHRSYMKGNIEAKATLSIIKHAKYYYLSIGTPSKPFDSSTVKFSIKLMDGMIFSSNELSFKNISSLPAIEKFTSFNGAMKEWLGEADVCFYIDDFSFIFKKKKLVGFRFEGWGKSKTKTILPMIGNITKTKFFKFPITQKQLESLFGKANKQIDRWYN
jgi:hypothetical protein